MAVPYTFGTATSSIPLSQLDSNFATVITLGNTAIQLGNTVTTLNNMTLANVTISSGNVTITNVAITTANVTTANITTAVIGTETVTTSTITTANVTTANITTGNITNGTVITSLTLSYGTANGVTYLNGSKVLTSGSALTFDGTNFATTGTATAAKLIPTGSSATGNGLYLPAANSVGISTNGTNAVYIDSTQNVGIGTSAPGAKLEVSGGTSAATLRLSTTNNQGGGAAPYNFGELQYWSSDAEAAQVLAYVNAVADTSSTLPGSILAFGTSAAGTGTAKVTERMRIDDSGGVQIGRTSVIGTSNRLAIQMSGTSASGYTAASNAPLAIDAGTSTNAVINMVGGGDMGIYHSNSSNAYDVGISLGSNADRIITFTTANAERMRLDSSGNVGIGTSSPATKLQINKSSQTPGDTTPSGALLITNTAAGDGCIEIGSGSSVLGYLQVRNRLSATYYDLAINPNGGNVGIGTSSPGTKLDVQGTVAGNFFQNLYNDSSNAAAQTLYVAKSFGASGVQFGQQKSTANGIINVIDATALTFGTSNTERMRIDSSGNLLVGTTSASSSITNGFTVTGPAAVTALGIGHVTGSGSGTNYVVFNYNGSAIGSITQDGTTGVLYNLTSDQRLKENIQDAAPASALIDAIQVRQFDWKSDNTHQRYGFVAQELVTVAPEAVHQPADPEEMMAVDYSKLVPMLVKEIQSLRKRLADAGIA